MRKIYSLIVLFTIVLLSSCAKDEVDTFGNIYGVVVNSNTSEPIQGARVTLTPTGKSTVTGNDGSYEFVDLEAGSYKVTVQADGYSSTVKNVTVVAGEKAIGDVSLSAKPQNTKLGVDKDIVLFTKSIRTATINIKNLGNSGNIDWTITNIPSWLTVSPEQGSTGVGRETAVALSLNSSFADKGEHVIIVNAAGESVSVLVNADTTSDEGTGGNDDGGDGETSDDYSSATVKSCDPDIELAITSCKRSGSNVIFKYYIISNKPEDIRDFRMYTSFGGTSNSQIADNTGKYYSTSEVNVKFNNQTPSVGSLSTQILKGVKTFGEITIRNVSEEATHLSVIKLHAYSYAQYDFLNEYLDFRNVPIY